VFNLGSGPTDPVFIDVPTSGRFPLPNGVFSRALPTQQRPPTVDAFNIMVQRQLSDVSSIEVGYVGNRGRDVFAGDGPAVNVNDPTLEGFTAGVPRNERRPFYSGIRTTYLGLGGPFGWTQGIDYFCNCANNWYDSLQTRFTRRFSDGYSWQINYTWQKAEGESGEYFFWNRDLNRGVQDWDRTHVFNLALVYELPFGRDKRWGSDWTGAANAILGGWQFNANQTFQSGVPFNVNYAGGGAERDVGPSRPNVSGDITINGGRDQYFDATPIGASGSPYTRPAAGTFGNLERNALRGPGYRRTDASLFKHVRFGGNRNLELRVEVVNLFNNVNLGNPDSEIGTATDPRTNAGRINSTAFGNADLQRNVQFGVRFQF
jgi:hypothetical protein